jgi:hypothetical protein
MYSKTKIGLNHLEQNILMGLKDTPTLTELVVLALYALSVSFLHMRVARGLTNGRRVNALDMGPFHAKVIAFCEAVADNPDLLLAPDASYKTGPLMDKSRNIRRPSMLFSKWRWACRICDRP